MARTVTDAAIVLSIIAGRDPLDNFTFAQPVPVPDYTKALNRDALKGARIGVLRQFVNSVTNTDELTAFNASVEIIRKLGATVIDPAEFPDFTEFRASGNETIVTQTDFKVRATSLADSPHIDATALDASADIHGGSPGGPYWCTDLG